MGIVHAWYRLYQAVMRAASYALDFSPPELLDGPGSLARLPGLVRDKGFSRVLVVTDKGLLSTGLLAGLFRGLESEGIAYTLFDGTQPNPTIRNVEDAYALYRAEGCQAVVAFGGGSPMDCAKGCAARVGNPRRSLASMRGLLKVWGRPAVIFAVPTTAGTGSETTLAAVISDPSTHEKYAINDPKLIPPYAVLDPLLTLGLPPAITATTGMDALTHAVEAYIGGSNTRETAERAEKAVSLIFKSLERAYAKGDDAGSRADMLLASFHAGFAFTRAYVGYVHAFAHQLGGLYGVAHGLANAAILPHVLDFCVDAAARPLARLADIAGVGAGQAGEAVKARAFIAAVRGMNARMGIPTGFTQVREEDVGLIVERAFREAHPLYPVPRIMTRAEGEALVRGLMIR